VDPRDQSVPVADRLIASRALLTRYLTDYEDELRALAQDQAHDDPLLAPDAPHNRVADAARTDTEPPAVTLFIDPLANRPTMIADPALVSDQEYPDDPVTRNEDEESLSQRLERLMRQHPTQRTTRGLTPQDRPAIAERANRTLPQRYRLTEWPADTSYGADHWHQLRWTPWRRLDAGQRRLDRFELGEWWHRTLRRQTDAHTEAQLEAWTRRQQLDGCIWAAPTETGWLPDPAAARVVVSGRHYRATAMWHLWLWPSDWTPDTIETYRQLTRPEGPPPELIDTCHAMSRRPDLAATTLAQWTGSHRRNS
jgi:hypothetical protein